MVRDTNWESWEFASMVILFLTECRYTKPATIKGNRLNELSVTLNLTYR